VLNIQQFRSSFEQESNHLFLFFASCCVNVSNNDTYIQPSTQQTLLLHYMFLPHNAASRKVAGSSPDEVDFLNGPNPSGRTMTLGSTQPLTEMSTRNL
jgi:hypothetical protein